MSGVYFLAPMLITILSSMLVVRAAAIALMMTGMSYDKAKFQALSAFSGTGFTTREAERVVNNPRRRRIVSWLMILGNAGIITVIVTASASFARAQGFEVGLNVLVLMGGLILLIVLARRTNLAARWEAFVRERLSRLPMFEDDATIDELLHISEGYGLVRVRITDKSALIGSSVSEANARLPHTSILGVERNHAWIAASSQDVSLAVGDEVVVYGRLHELVEQFT